MKNTIVKMKHPDVEPLGEATERAFTKVWEPKGWRLATDAEIEADRQRIAAAKAEDDAVVTDGAGPKTSKSKEK